MVWGEQHKFPLKNIPREESTPLLGLRALTRSLGPNLIYGSKTAKRIEQKENFLPMEYFWVEICIAILSLSFCVHFIQQCT